jgi:hypothetical protein
MHATAASVAAGELASQRGPSSSFESYARFLFAKSQFTTFQNASMNLGRALR